MESVQVITSVERKRRFREDEKRGFLFEAQQTSLAAVSRKYQIAPSLLHSWKKKYRESPRFVAARIAAPEEAGNVRVFFADGLQLDLPTAFAPTQMVEFINALRR